MTESARKRRLILHIGTYKTGSTYLQHFLRKNRKRNLRKYGIYYPITDQGEAPERERKHSLLSAAIQAHRVQEGAAAPMPPPDAVIEMLSEDILNTRAHTALISAEGLSRPSPCFAQACSAFSHHFKVEVVIFLRRQDLFVESLHKQFIREGHETRSLEEFLASRNVRAWLNYRRIIQYWEAAFGGDSVKVIPFEKSNLQEGLITTFARSLALPIVTREKSPRNVSLSREVAEILRRVNRSGLLKGRGPSARKQRMVIIRAMRDLQIDTGTTAILSGTARKELLQGYQHGNSEIARCYLHRTDNALFQDGIDEGDYPGENWCMTDGEAMEHLARIVAHLAGIVLTKPSESA